MKNKGTFICIMLLGLAITKLQAQTAQVLRGFVLPKQAIDSVFAQLKLSKNASVLAFTASKDTFIFSQRKRDSITPDLFLSGQWSTYTATVNKGFKRLYKSVKGKPYYIKTATTDTFYVTETSDSLVKRVEWILKRKKTGYTIKFSLWQMGYYWYLYDKFQWYVNEE